MELEWDHDDYQGPHADPQIKMDYEAALGRLILAHNEVDFRLAKELERIFQRIDPNHSPAMRGVRRFAERVNCLEIVQKLLGDRLTVNVDVAELRRLNDFRNAAAHGHFDQDYFDGSYTIIRSDTKARAMPVVQLDEAAKALHSIAVTLSNYEAFGQFGREYASNPTSSPE